MELRVIREGLREQGKSITGAPLAKGLSKYSIRGEEYIQEIRQMIRFNGLERYDLMLLQDPDPSAQVFSGQQAA